MNQTHFHRRNLPHFYRLNSTYFITYRLKGTIPLKVLKELKAKYINDKNPKTKIEKYKNEKQFFAIYDKYLDNNKNIQYLMDKEIAKIVKESLHYYDSTEYNLICYTIMPNHVHVVFHLLEDNIVKQKDPQTGKFTIRKNVQHNFQSVNKNITQNKNTTTHKNVPQTFQSVKNEMNVTNLMKSIKGYSAREANKILNRKGNFWQSESYDHIVRDYDELERIIRYVVMNPVKVNLAEKWEDWEYTYLAEQW